jgi:hypothetical protein
LAESFEPEYLQTSAGGFGLYSRFRPEVDEWGKRSEVRLATVLKLRRPKYIGPPQADGKVITKE